LSFSFQLSEDTLVGAVRTWLGLESYKDCVQLSREEAVAVLRIMLVFRYEETSFFRGLWRIPPLGISRTEWIDTYGEQAGVLKSGKGKTAKSGLCMRVAHYLGFSSPDQELAAPEDANLMAMNITELTADSLAALMAKFQAEQDFRSLATANHVTSQDTGAAPVNAPASNGTQG
jgi:hypothetical protein